MKKIKKNLKKILVCILICFVINNFFISNLAFADDAKDDNAFADWLEGILGAVIGLLTYPIRLIAVGIGFAIEIVTTLVAYTEGTIDSSGNIDPDGSKDIITPFDILFNKVAIVDIDFFDIKDDDTVIYNIRRSVAGWYYVMRMIAAAILLCVLIYVGIRMAISTIASDQARYKKMLVDWVCSLAIIFILHYIIIFTFAVNDAFINALSGIDDGTKISEATKTIRDMSTKLFSVNSLPATIVYCMLVIQTIGLFISYFNRMLKIAFLILISPLITLTYSIDKMGDGKAQALNTWLKEFVYTVMLQTFHCVIYMVFVCMALSVLEGAEGENALAGAIIAMLCIKFIKKGEELLGKIFSFSDSTSDSSIASGMGAAAAVYGVSKSLGSNATKAINGARNMNLGGRLRTAKVEAMALGGLIASKKNEDGSKKSWEELKDDANTKVTEKEASKAEKKNARKYGVSTKDKAYQKDVSKRANELMQQTGMTKNLAFATARAEKAKQSRKEAKDSKLKSKHPNIYKARGTINKMKEVKKAWSNSETNKVLKEIGGSVVNSGMNLAMGSFVLSTDSKADDVMAAFMMTNRFSGSNARSNSAKTLVNEGDKLVKGLGATNSAQAENQIRTTQAMAPLLSDNSELQKHLDDLLKFVEDAVKDNGGDPKDVKNTIKNTVAKNIKKNPEISNADLMAKVGEDLNNKYGAKNPGLASAVTSLPKFNDGVSNVADMTRRKELFDTMQSANSINLNSDTFTRMVSKQFIDSDMGEDRFKSKEEIISKVSNEGYTVTESDLDSRTEKDLRKIEQKLNQEFEEAQSSIDYDTMSSTEINSIIDKQENIAENIQAVMDKELTEVMDRYSKEFDKLTQELNATVDERVQDKIREKIQELGEDYQKELSKFDGHMVCSARPDNDQGTIVNYVTEETMNEAIRFASGFNGE